MRITRIVTWTVTAGLVGLTPIAIAAPSQAAATYTTSVVAAPTETRIIYGDTLSVDVDVDSQTGSAPSGGTTTLLAQEAGSASFVPVATTEGAYAYFTDVKPQAGTTYKVAYSGATSFNGDVYQPSESATFTVQVARKITYPSSGFVLKGKVTPDYGKKKIVIKVSKKQNKGYKKFKTIKTTSAGKYKITLPRRGGTWYWSFVVKGDDKYLANGFVWKTFIG
ncbi:hypothetical protein EUA06_06530 [Nocardioides glacieisoli]|uniref:Bacterial Ig-like domain-containing protein n=1 Tax=Nocardioides glacieisoli TaxID=1168730 RepID=A0A4Q2RVB5_9ACTN|nr:hypothetical protein [Nocardioides glacieisoli]RYB92596.1 hypothetical protein EUA06_06530 [Nocardioides glacieisoli]